MLSYFIGNSLHWEGATVFWQIDQFGVIRTGKIIQFNPNTGRRIKEPESLITWVHSINKIPNFKLNQCFFGEHLLKDHPYKPIGIVESEKTAVIANIYLPQLVWIATGGIGNLNEAGCRVLKGRDVTLFPDLGGFDKWQIKAKQLRNIIRFSVSDLLENNANEKERKNGLDLADYLIKFDVNDFSQDTSEQHENDLDTLTLSSEEISNNLKPSKYINKGENELELDHIIVGLETFFRNIALPEDPIEQYPGITIIDPSLFINSHLTIVKSQNGKAVYKPYLNRLVDLRKYLIRNGIN